MHETLERIVRESEARARAGRARVPEAELRRRIASAPPPPRLAFDASGFDLIAEVKRRSPSEGPIAAADREVEANGEDGRAARATRYARAGAAAVSVLTEPAAFGGSLSDLEAVAVALGRLPDPIPAMRKDFLVDPWQVLEARAAGAGGVLLILRLVDDARLFELLDAAAESDLFVLLEAFQPEEIVRASEAAARAGRGGVTALVGLNARDLGTLRVEPERLTKLAGRLPYWAPRVAESGLSTPEEVGRAAALGYDVALVGTALMRQPDPTALLSEMLRAGRDAKRAVAALSAVQGAGRARRGGEERT